MRVAIGHYHVAKQTEAGPCTSQSRICKQNGVFCLLALFKGSRLLSNRVVQNDDEECGACVADCHWGAFRPSFALPCVLLVAVADLFAV